MDVNLEWDGNLKLKKFRTTNKVTEDREELTAYLKMTGLMPARLFSWMTGADAQDMSWRRFFWAEDEAPAHPGMDAVTFMAAGIDHVVEIGGKVKYRDDNAEVRRFKCKPAYGEQWLAEFEILLRPTKPAVIGNLAEAEGHDIDIKILGSRHGRDIFEENDDK